MSKKDYTVYVTFRGGYTAFVSASSEDEAEDIAIDEMREEYGEDVEVDDVYAQLEELGEKE